MGAIPVEFDIFSPQKRHIEKKRKNEKKNWKLCFIDAAFSSGVNDKVKIISEMAARLGKSWLQECSSVNSWEKGKWQKIESANSQTGSGWNLRRWKSYKW